MFDTRHVNVISAFLMHHQPAGSLFAIAPCIGTATVAASGRARPQQTARGGLRYSRLRESTFQTPAAATSGRRHTRQHQRSRRFSPQNGAGVKMQLAARH